MIQAIMFSFRKKSILLYLKNSIFPVLVYPMNEGFFSSFSQAVGRGTTYLSKVKLDIPEDFSPEENEYLPK